MEEKKRRPWSFCDTPKEKCTMNFCHENGCKNKVKSQQEEFEELKYHLLYNFLEFLSINDVSFEDEEERGGAVRKYLKELQKQSTEGN